MDAAQLLLEELQERVSLADAARALTELSGVYVRPFLYSLPTRPLLSQEQEQTRAQHKCVWWSRAHSASLLLLLCSPRERVWVFRFIDVPYDGY
jgi:hypothetical protein